MGVRFGSYTHPIKAIGFKMGKKIAPKLRHHTHHVGLIGYLTVNTFRHQNNVELIIKHVVHYRPQLNRAIMIKLYKNLVLLDKSKHSLTLSALIKQVVPSLSAKTVKNGLRVFNELNLVRHPFKDLSLVKHPEMTSLLNSKIYQKLSI